MIVSGTRKVSQHTKNGSTGSHKMKAHTRSTSGNRPEDGQIYQGEVFIEAAPPFK